MTLWGNREGYEQGQQRPETVGELWQRAVSSSGRHSLEQDRIDE